jgi:hypothetical protein
MLNNLLENFIYIYFVIASSLYYYNYKKTINGEITLPQLGSFNKCAFCNKEIYNNKSFAYNGYELCSNNCQKEFCKTISCADELNNTIGIEI